MGNCLPTAGAPSKLVAPLPHNHPPIGADKRDKPHKRLVDAVIDAPPQAEIGGTPVPALYLRRNFRSGSLARTFIAKDVRLERAMRGLDKDDANGSQSEKQTKTGGPDIQECLRTEKWRGQQNKKHRQAKENDPP